MARGLVPTSSAAVAPRQRLPGDRGPAAVSATDCAPRHHRRTDGRGSRLPVGDGLRRGGRALADQRPLRAALADGGVRAPRVGASPDRGTGGVGLDARRCGGPPACRRRERPCRRAGSNARATRRSLLPAGPAPASGLACRLFLPARVDRLSPRDRDRARDRPAGEAPRSPRRCDGGPLRQLWEVVRELGQANGDDDRDRSRLPDSVARLASRPARRCRAH